MSSPAEQGLDLDSSGTWRELYAISFRTAHRIIPDDADAQDIAQRTLLQAYVRRAVIQNPGAWVAAVARRLAWRLLQKLRRFPTAPLDARTPDPKSQLSGIEQTLLVAAVLDRLRPGQRELLSLAREGLTQREIAAVLCCEVHQVGPRLARAQRAARRLRDESRGGPTFSRSG